MTRRLKEFLSDTTRKRRILALDGGGVRGLMTLGVLSKLEAELSKRSGDPDYRLSQYFDLIGGTSTGSIIATGLAHGWRVSRVQKAYHEIVPKIFKRVAAWGLLAPKYREKPLIDALTEFFGEATLDSPELETGLAIFAKRMNSGSAWVFCNNPNWSFYDNVKPGVTYAPNCSFKLRSLVQASAAAPHYFRGVQMQIETAKPGVANEPAYFIDGGVGGYNNPALELLTVVRDPAYGFNWPLGADNLYILSIGTGWTRELTKPGGIFFLQTVGALRAMINDVSLQQIAYMQALGRPQMPWYINTEKQHQMGRAYLSPNDMPTLSYQRVDVRFGEDTDHAGALLPDTAHALRGKKLKGADLKGLRNIANSKRRNSELLTDLGEKAGARLIQNAPPPHEFDHSPGQWTRIGQEGPGTQRG
jgi:uncharacterized protein